MFYNQYQKFNFFIFCI